MDIGEQERRIRPMKVPQPEKAPTKEPAKRPVKEPAKPKEPART